MKVYAYDLDGVLCAAPPPAPKSWGKMNGRERNRRKEEVLRYYAEAPQLHVPEVERFFVITARKYNAENLAATAAWLERMLPGRVERLFMLSGARTIKTVVAYKAEVLRQVGATDYTEDNRDVVRELRRQGLDCRVWHFKGGKVSLE